MGGRRVETVTVSAPSVEVKGFLAPVFLIYRRKRQNLEGQVESLSTVFFPGRASRQSGLHGVRIVELYAVGSGFFGPVPWLFKSHSSRSRYRSHRNVSRAHRLVSRRRSSSAVDRSQCATMMSAYSSGERATRMRDEASL